MDTAKNPLTLATMIETLLRDGYMMHFESKNGVFVVAKPSEEEIHFDGNFLEAIREPFFGPKELRDSNDPRIKNLSSEATGLETGVTVTGKSIERSCPHCGHTSRKYKVSFSSVHLNIAKTLFKYCVDNKTYIITRSEIAPFLSHANYANFSFLQRFGLMYFIERDGKRVRGEWGVPLKRLSQFLKNEWKVAEYFWRDKDESTNQMSENRILMEKIPKYEKILDPETMLPVFLEFEQNPYFESHR